MPKKTEGLTGVYVEMEPDVLALMRRLAAGNGRAFRDELMHACRRHLAYPPKVRVVVEEVPLPPAVAEAPARRRGRPRGAGGGRKAKAG